MKDEKGQSRGRYQQITQQNCIERPVRKEALRFYQLVGEIDVGENHEKCYRTGAKGARVLRGYDAQVYISWGD